MSNNTTMLKLLHKETVFTWKWLPTVIQHIATDTATNFQILIVSYWDTNVIQIFKF